MNKKIAFRLCGLITLIASANLIIVSSFKHLELTAMGITLFCLSNALFRMALRERYELTDAVVSALAKIHDKELKKFIEEKQKEMEESKKKRVK